MSVQGAPRKWLKRRRLVWRMLRNWQEIVHGAAFRAATKSITGSWASTRRIPFLIEMQAPIELSHFVAAGVNLAVALCPTDTLVRVLLSRVPPVVCVAAR
jgi:hypothetical protein